MRQVMIRPEDIRDELVKAAALHPPGRGCGNNLHRTCIRQARETIAAFLNALRDNDEAMERAYSAGAMFTNGTTADAERAALDAAVTKEDR